MLVLSLKNLESIYITVGDTRVQVQLVDIRRGKIRLGVKAPDEVEINRACVQEAIDFHDEARRTFESKT